MKTFETPQNKATAEAVKKANDTRIRNTMDLQSLLKQDNFKNYIKRWVTDLRAFSSAYSPNSSEMYRNAGRQSVAQEIILELRIADPAACDEILGPVLDAEADARIQALRRDRPGN